MNPFEDFNVHVLTNKNCLSNDFKCPLYKHGLEFPTVTRLFLYEKALENGCPMLTVLIHAAKNDGAMYRAASRVTVKDCWFGKRVGVMRDILELKISMLEELEKALRQSGHRRIVQPGNPGNAYFTCGCYTALAQVLNPTSYPGQDYMSVFWEEKRQEAGLMDDIEDGSWDSTLPV